MKRLFESGYFWLILSFVFLAAGIGLTVWFWGWLHPVASPTASKSETLRNVGLLLGGGLAFVFAVWRSMLAERQAATAKDQADTAKTQADTAKLQADTVLRSLLNERHERGTDMLGSPTLSFRLGGISALRRLAEEHPEQYHIQIMDQFCAFVRHPAGSEDVSGWPHIAKTPNPTVIREDVQAALTAIARRSEAGLACERAANNFRLNLRGADLGSVSLRGANLARAELQFSNLAHADLSEADLSGAILLAANLSRSLLLGSLLLGSNLQNANLSHAMFHNVNRSNTSLYANLSNAHLDSADLSGATIGCSDLSGAILHSANLSGAIFGVGMRRTSSNPTVLEEVFPRLTQSQLDEARADPDNPPTIPKGTVDIETAEPLAWRGTPLDNA